MLNGYYEVLLLVRKHDTLTNVGTMLNHRLRRWPNIKPKLI